MNPQIFEIVSKSGFAVVTAVAMAWYITSTQDDYKQERRHWQTEHKQERKEWLSVIRSENELNRQTTEKLTDVVYSLRTTIAKDQ